MNRRNWLRDVVGIIVGACASSNLWLALGEKAGAAKAQTKFTPAEFISELRLNASDGVFEARRVSMDENGKFTDLGWSEVFKVGTG